MAKILSTLKTKEICLIDHDIVESSNLNRQFYFNQKEIGGFKANLLKEKLLQNNKTLNINAYCLKIQDKSFDLKFFERFNIFLSALDNKEAKKYLSKIAIVLNIPLIIAGIEGFLGQIRTIIRGKTECLYCDDKNLIISNEDFVQNEPLCTIKGIPTKNIHCAHWAIEWLKKQTKIKDNIYDFVEKTFEITNFSNVYIDFEKNTCFNDDLKIWSYNESLSIFLYYLVQINEKLPIKINLEDYKIVRIICALTNIRIYKYMNENSMLKPVSITNLKHLIGLIIPAIASSNSIAAGIMISQMLLILNNKDFNGRIWFNNENIDKIIGNKDFFYNINCSICGKHVFYIKLEINFDLFTIKVYYKNNNL